MSRDHEQSTRLDVAFGLNCANVASLGGRSKHAVGVGTTETKAVRPRDDLKEETGTNVACVGSSWVAPQKLIEAGDFAAITALAREAAELRRG